MNKKYIATIIAYILISFCTYAQKNKMSLDSISIKYFSGGDKLSSYEILFIYGDSILQIEGYDSYNPIKTIISIDIVNQLTDYVNAFHIEKTEKIAIGFNENGFLDADWPAICVRRIKVFTECTTLMGHVAFNPKFEEFHGLLKELVRELVSDPYWRFSFYEVDKQATPINGHYIGHTQFKDYLLNNLSFSNTLRQADKNGGYIHITFIVERDGSLTYISHLFAKDKVHRAYSNKAWVEEFRKVFSNAPRWKPAILNGRRVRQDVSISIGDPE